MVDDSKILTKKKDSLPQTSDGNIDWKEYYDSITPKMSKPLKEVIPSESPFTPEYSDTPFLEDKNVFQDINDENGMINFIDTVPASSSIEEENQEIDPDIHYPFDEKKDEEEEQLSKDIYINSIPNEGDLFLIIINEKKMIIDKLITVQSINTDDLFVHFKDEDDNDLTLFLNDEHNIILKSDEYDYDILEFEKIEEINIKELNDNNILITKDIYSDFEFDVEERKDKIYTIEEKRESLITELITILKAHDDKSLISTICDIADNYIIMMENNRNISNDYLDQLPFLRDVNDNDYHLPGWIIPIVDNIKKIFLEEGEDRITQSDNSYHNLNNELKEKDKILSSNDPAITQDQSSLTYQKFYQSLIKFGPFYNKESNTIIYHDGHYIRDCNDVQPCNGINGEYIFDYNKTRKSNIIPLMKDKTTYYEIINPKEKLSITGFYILPHNYLDLTFKPDNILSLFEVSLLSNKKYSFIPFNNRLIHNQIIPHIIGPNTSKEDFVNNMIHSYLFDSQVTIDNLKQTLSNNLPNISDIINSIPEKLIPFILNHNDLNKLLLPYKLSYNTFDQNNKNKINGLIKKNINKYVQNYNKTVKRKIIKPIKKVDKVLSTKDKIKLSRDYILSIFIIPLQNSYIHKFIQKFSREPFENENQNYLYEKGSEDKLICKHYLYSSKIEDDPDAHITLKRLFGSTPRDGIIYCNECGGYLCPEDDSLLEGFSDNTPKISKEVLENNTENLTALNDKQVLIKKTIHKISSLLSIELNEYDKMDIINYFDLINNDEIIDIRYKNSNTFKKHPQYKEIKHKYKFIKPAIKEIDRQNNKKNNTLMKKDINQFKEYLIHGNELLIITFLILFHLQVSFPPYEIKGKFILDLWNTSYFNKNKWSEINDQIHTKVSMKTINYVFNLLNQFSKTNKKDPFWKNTHKLFDEEKKYKDLIKLKNQFLQIIFYTLKNTKLRNKLKDYYNYQNDINGPVYLKEYWSTYKPLYDNSIIIKINNDINKQLEDTDLSDYLIKKGSTISYENVSTIQEINDVYSTSKHKRLKIPFSGILKNEAYIRLLDYSIHLHGKSGQINRIDLLIEYLINTIEHSLEIERIIESIGWDKNKKTLKEINYTQLRGILLKDIPNIFKNKNKDEEDIIDIFQYIKINNWNGMLLNSYPKRNYSYTQPIVFPNKNFTELKKEHDKLKQKEQDEGDIDIIGSLFKKYCLDDDGDINKKLSHDDFILNIVAEPSFEREVICNKDITINEENFLKILEYNTKSNILSFNKIIPFDDFIYEKRLYDFINQNKLLDHPADESYQLIERIHNLYSICSKEREYVKKEYREVFNQIEDYKIKGIDYIQHFISKSIDDSIINIQQINYYKKYRISINKLNIYLNNYLNNSTNIENNISQIIYIIGRLSNSKSNQSTGTVLSDHIPPQWKLTETNENDIQNFINNKEFLLHNDIFLDSKKYEGFYNYLSEDKYSVCFIGLLSHLKESYQTGIHNLSGDDNSFYTKTYHQLFIKFFFVFLFRKIIEYIESLYDEQSLSSQKAIELFLLLEEENELELKNSIELCTQLMFDILMHFLDENDDPNWIFKDEDLSDKLSKQKEMEKQNIINDLESKTAEERHATVQLEKAGIISWYHRSDEANLERLKSNKYEEQLSSDRINNIKEILLQDENYIEMCERQGVPLENIMKGLVDEQPEDTGYSQEDQDREDEGLDDPDINGDYKEN